MINRLKELIPARYRPLFRAFYYRSRYHLFFLHYKGSALQCPFCEKGFRKFLSAGVDSPALDRARVVGGGRRPNVVCPRCTSTDRERLIYLYLLKKKAELFSRELRVLHVAPERSLQRVLRNATNIDYISADIESPMADVKMDITAIQFPNDSFDGIICNHVLEHIQNDRLALSELYRVLRPGGWAILQVPISLALDTTVEDPNIVRPEDRERVFGQRDHVRIYGQDYISRLKVAGFDAIAATLGGEVGGDPLERFGLSADERIYVCAKPVARKGGQS
jgi:SAM-dependent methyltransferase